MKSGLVLLSIASVSLLSACGGGSSGGAGNSAPQVSNLQVVDENGGGLAIGDTLRATYTYSDAEGDVEGESVITWLRDGVAITGATGKTYVLTLADIGKKISFSVLAKALTGTLEGTLTLENTAPTATGVALSGTTTVGQTLTGAYTYADADSDAEGTSTFRWLRDGVAISGATGKTYTLTADDVGKTIKFAVTPVAAAGTTTGTEVESAASAAVTAAANAAFAPTDPLLPDQWYIENKGVAPANWGQYKDLTQSADARVRGAWNMGVSGEGVTVTVVDDGVDFTHSDLASQEVPDKSGSLEAGQEGSGLPADISASHHNDHGTGCAGIIAAKSDASGVVGIAANAKLISIRTLGITTKSQTAEAAHVKILRDDVSQVSNHSYGPTDNGKLSPQNEQRYNDIKALVTGSNKDSNGKPKGHVMLVAAGNGRAYVPRKIEPSEISSDYASADAKYDININIGDYAGLDMSQQNPYSLSISGFNANDMDVSYAEAGPATLVAGATGDSNSSPSGVSTTGATRFSNVNWTKKDTADMATTGRTDTDYTLNSNYGSHRSGGTEKEPAGYNFAFNGTSAATPVVTGVVALIRSANPDLTWRDVRWILAKTARKIQAGSTITDQTTGEPSAGSYAKPIWSTSGNSEFGFFSHYFGYGAVNAEAAVTLAKSSNYQKLPDMTECTLTVTNNAVDKDANTTCPATIEFVQVGFTVKGGTDVNKLDVSMTLKDDAGKTINLISPSTCNGGEGNCNVTSDTTVKSGTTGFMGDALSDGTGNGFRFAVKSNGAVSENVVINNVTVFGFTRPAIAKIN